MTEEKQFLNAIRSNIRLYNKMKSKSNKFINLISLLRLINMKVDKNKNLVVKYKFQILNILNYYDKILNFDINDKSLKMCYSKEYELFLKSIN